MLRDLGRVDEREGRVVEAGDGLSAAGPVGLDERRRRARLPRRRRRRAAGSPATRHAAGIAGPASRTARPVGVDAGERVGPGHHPAVADRGDADDRPRREAQVSAELQPGPAGRRLDGARARHDCRGSHDQRQDGPERPGRASRRRPRAPDRHPAMLGPGRARPPVRRRARSSAAAARASPNRRAPGAYAPARCRPSSSRTWMRPSAPHPRAISSGRHGSVGVNVTPSSVSAAPVSATVTPASPAASSRAIAVSRVGDAGARSRRRGRPHDLHAPGGPGAEDLADPRPVAREVPVGPQRERRAVRVLHAGREVVAGELEQDDVGAGAPRCRRGCARRSRRARGHPSCGP